MCVDRGDMVSECPAIECMTLCACCVQEIPDKDNVLVVTQLRDPVQRVLSSYEFTVQSAGGFLGGLDARMDSMPEIKTYDVWPWKHLVYPAAKSITERLKNPSKLFSGFKDDKSGNTEEKKKSTESGQKGNSVNPYDNEIIPPLKEWIETPEVIELIHNGHVLQILGISNTSSWAEAGALRECFIRDEDSRSKLFDLAVKKLKEIPHAGISSRLNDAVSSLGASLGKKMEDTVYRSVAMKWFFFDDRDNIPDFNTRITYNSTIEGDQHKTVSLREARWRLNKITKEEGKASHQLEENTKLLEDLLEEQKTWLAEQGASSGQNRNDLLRKSPFLQRIETARGLVDLLTNNQKAMQTDMETLKNIDIVKGKPFGPNTKAFLAWMDEDAIFSDRNLGSNFGECSSESKSSESEKSLEAFRKLRTEDGESFQFDYESRKQIDDSIIERIKELNQMDMKIMEIGSKVFDETLDKQRSLGLLQRVPRPEGKSSSKSSPSQETSEDDLHDPTEL